MRMLGGERLLGHASPFPPWHADALRSYRAWVDTWYRPSSIPRLGRCFTFASYHAHGCEFWAPGAADKAIAGIPDGIDQLHFIAQKVDRYGVYDHYRDDWGLDGLQRFVQAAQARGKVCSHYFQGYLAHADSEVFRQRGDAWGLKNPDGSNATAFANNCMCLSATGWHDWLADTTSRAVRDLGLDIVYLDCLGWTTAEKFICSNRSHEHPPEYHRLSTVRDLLYTVKRAIRAEKPHVALTTEGPAVDLFLNDVDGNEGYGAVFFQHPAYGPPVHFMRFIYPEFKYLDLRTGSAEMVKQALFNATATDADPRTLPEARTAHRVFHENHDALVDASSQHLPHLRGRRGNDLVQCGAGRVIQRHGHRGAHRSRLLPPIIQARPSARKTR